MEPSFAVEIEEAADGEAILVIVISEENFPRPYKDQNDVRRIPANLLNRRLTWEQARPLLDYAYDAGFGGQDCHDITAWTKTQVFFVWEYDGSTHIVGKPRNPPRKMKQKSPCNECCPIEPGDLPCRCTCHKRS